MERENKLIVALNKLDRAMEDVKSEWDGDEAGLKEDNAEYANDVQKHIEGIKEALANIHVR